MEKALYDMIVESSQSLASNHGIKFVSESNPEDGFNLLRNESALTAFAESLVADEKFSTQDKNAFVAYAKNSAKQFVAEATTSQDIKPFASFQILLLKEIYARQIGRRLVTTEILPTPEETVGTFKSVLVDAAGVEHDLIDIDSDTEIADGWHEDAVTAQVTKALFESANMTDDETAVLNKMLDVATSIVSVTMEYKNTAGTVVGTATIVINATFGEDNGFAKKVSYKHTDGTVTTDTAFGLIDYKTGKVSLSSGSGAVKTANVRWRLSNSYAEINEYEIQLSYKKEKVIIDDGELFNVGIPLNYLQDVNAFFSIDGMSKAVEQIASAINVLDDRKILRAVKDAVGSDITRTQTFDYALPTSGISRAEHNKGLLEAINKSIAISDNNTQFKTISEYNIACNPIDAAVITSPVLLNDSNMSNVSVTSGSMNYNAVPMVSPAGVINILSTKLQARGSLYIVPKGSAKEERVIGKFKYSSVIYQNNEIRSRNNPNIKTLAARHREKINVFEAKAITKVVIQNN